MSITTPSNPQDDPVREARGDGEAGVDGEDEGWEEEEDEGDYDDYDEDVDAKAEEIARMWGNDLLAQINAHAAAAASASGISNGAVPAPDANTHPLASLFPGAPPATSNGGPVDDNDAPFPDHDIPDIPFSPPASPPPPHASKKVQDALQTMRSILTFASKYPAFTTSLSRALVPGPDGGNVFDVLTRTSTAGNISKDLSRRLQPLILALVSDAFFSPPPPPPPPPPAVAAPAPAPFQVHPDSSGAISPITAPTSAPAPDPDPFPASAPASAPTSSFSSSLLLSPSKRKRSALSPSPHPSEQPPLKRPTYTPPSHPLQIELEDACSDIAAALTHALDARLPPSAALIAPLAPPLHAVFLFALTAPAETDAASALRDVGALAQALGVLAHTPVSHPPPSSAPDIAVAVDIRTAVHPCPFPACHKTFARLPALRAHERAHAASCPFACAVCGATFVLEDDLRRHAPLHARRTWRCPSCATVFARKDALADHVRTAPACAECASPADAGEGEGAGEAEKGLGEAHADGGGGERERGARTESPYPDAFLEEGEIHVEVLRATQATVLTLHPLLHSFVAQHAPAAAAAPSASASAPSFGTGGQATLASLLANAHAAPPDAPSGGPPLGLSDAQAQAVDEAVRTAVGAARRRAEEEASRED